MVVETRSQNRELNNVRSEETSDAAPVTLLTAATRPRSHDEGSNSSSASRVSATMLAKKLAAEAQHARRVAELELAARRAELERSTAELELRAELAAIEAQESSRGSNCSSSHAPVKNWLQDCDAGNEATPLQIVGQLPATPLQKKNASGDHAATSGDVEAAAVPAADISNKDALVTIFKLLANKINTNTSNPSPKNIHVNLPLFDGKSPTDWLGFKRIYSDTQSSYSAAENLARLSLALRGAARDAVCVLLVSARDPADVIRALDMRFGRPELIVINETNSVRALPKVSMDGKDLALFACRVRNCVEIIRLLNQTDYLRSPELFNALVTKLPLILRTRWLDYAFMHETNEFTKIEMFANFLMREVDLQTKFGAFVEPSTSSYDTRRFRDKVNMISNCESDSSKSLTKNISSCLYCQQNHNLSQCDNFRTLTVDDRWQWIKKEKVCYRCLKRSKHNFRTCKVKNRCGIEGCTSKHHKLFHKTEQNVVTRVNVDGNNSMPSTSNFNVGTTVSQVHEGSSETVTHTTSMSDCAPCIRVFAHRPLLKVIAVTVSGPFGSIDTYALLDDGSTATFIDAEISARIGITGSKGNIQIDCVGGLSKQTSVQYVDFQIKGKYLGDTFLIKRARSISGLGITRQSIRSDDIRSFSHLSDLTDMLCYDDAKPTIIIGIDNWHLIISKETRKGTKSQPVAIRTALGWVLFGFGCNRTKAVELVNHTTLEECDRDYSLLENLIKEQYKLDSIGISKRETRSSEDDRAVQILERTARRLSVGRYEAGLLWKSDNLVVPNSYGLAMSRFLSLEKKMAKEPHYAERYRQNVQDILKKGFAELCREVKTTSICWYLPHFGVINPNKPAKLRIVHDAAAKVSGVSLNSLLLTGPDLLQPLFDILLRFREEKIALTADIREMFPQVKIIETDRDAQRFLWRDNPNDDIKIYRMSSMIFGAASSPFTALYIKNKNALELQSQWPDAAHAIIFDHYMDDYIGSVESVDKAARLAADIVAVHEKAGFEMRGWVSNDPSALSLVPKNLWSNPSLADVDVDLGSLNTTVRTLGVIWQPMKDVVSFNIGIKDNLDLPVKLTKRAVLSHVMRVYDPLGIITPIVIKGRIMLQNIIRKKLDWDDELSQVDKVVWYDWFNDLGLIQQLRISRRYSLSELVVCERELHIFSDASELAYAAVGYWRFVYANGDIKLSLISGKARVSPLKPISIPRLELQGALIAARLASSICEAVRHKPTKRFFWCDSMTVLGWLRSDARNFKPFVAHRVGEILEITNVCEWHWIPTNKNVADDATRLKRGTLTTDSRWITGPPFLLSARATWPNEPSEVSTELSLTELKSSAHVHHTQSVELHEPLAANPIRFSSWLRLIRVTATAHKFIRSLRARSLIKKGIDPFSITWSDKHICYFFSQASSSTSSASASRRNVRRVGVRALTAKDIKLAEMHVLRRSQLDSFHKEIVCLKLHQPLPKPSRLLRSSPVIEEDELLRLSSRVDLVDGVDEEAKRPIVLDGKHPAVRLLVLHYHQKAAHASTEMVVNELRQRYWILNLRSTVRSVSHHCQQCQLARSAPLRPPEGDLPKARLSHHCRPFTFVGLDYFGPVLVMNGRRKEKVYVALYTCLVTRALHLELVSNLSADAAMMSLRRFIARRGTPSEIYSDNGTAFVGVNNQLKALYGEPMSEFSANAKIEWKFIPPSAPFMGGAWERLVRSVKTALKVTLKQRTPSLEVFSTLLLEAEALVNSRPLTHVSDNPDYPEAITPFHFLLGTSSGHGIEASLDDKDLYRRSDWRKAARLVDHFWRRWVSEYLPVLIPRKGQGSPPDVSVGDVVFIADGNLPRGIWPKGRISAVFPGRDGIIRVADVTTSAGVLRRPVRKLVPIVKGGECA